MFRLAFTALFGLLLLTAASGVSFAQDDDDPPPPKKLPGLKVNLPDADGYEKKAPRTYNSPGLGWSVTYNGKISVATVFVYNMDRDEIPDGPNSDVLKSEMYEVTTILEAQKEKGVYKKVVPIKEGVAPLGGGKTGTKFRFKRYEIDIPKVGPAITEIHLTGYKNYFVKIFVTYRLEDEEDALDEIKELMTTLNRTFK